MIGHFPPDMGTSKGADCGDMYAVSISYSRVPAVKGKGYVLDGFQFLDTEN